MINLAIALFITLLVFALIIYNKKKDEEHKKGDYLIDNIHFPTFKDGKK